MPEALQKLRNGRHAMLRAWNLRGLAREHGRRAPAVAAAIRSAREAVLSPEEQARTEAIERLRAELNASTVAVTRLDFGAGSPDAGRTADAMRAGVETPDTVGGISRLTSKSPFWCRVLFHIIRSVRPASCVEMGTSVGISAAYQATALELNGSGALVTLEGAPAVAAIARENFRRLGLGRVEVVEGRFQDSLPAVLRASGPVDYAFVDGHHDEEATLGYFEQLLPALAGEAVLVFDDITWSEGMKRAWGAISRDRRAGIAVELGPVGVCLVQSSVPRRRYYDIPLW